MPMSEKITDKIKKLLTPSDLKVFEEAVEKMIATRVNLKEEETKNKYDELAEAYCTKRIAEETEKAKAALIESYDEKLVNLEKKVVNKLDSYIAHVIAEQISDETLEKIAVNETALPLMLKIKALFAEHYVNIDSDGAALLKKEKEKTVEMETKINDLSKKLVEAEERLEKSASFLLISEKTDGLTETQKQRVVKMFKSKNFNEIKENIDEFISMIKESNEKKTTVEKEDKTIDTVLENETTVVTEEKKVIVEETNNATLASAAERWI
jgi:hypothetical protein